MHTQTLLSLSVICFSSAFHVSAGYHPSRLIPPDPASAPGPRWSLPVPPVPRSPPRSPPVPPRPPPSPPVPRGPRRSPPIPAGPRRSPPVPRPTPLALGGHSDTDLFQGHNCDVGNDLTPRFSMQIQGRPRPGDRTIRVSDFMVHNSGFKKALADPKPAGSSFLISRFWFPKEASVHGI